MSTSTHPMYLAAAGAVIVTCGVAVASMTGLIPDTKAEPNNFVTGAEANLTEKALAESSTEKEASGTTEQAVAKSTQPATKPKPVVVAKASPATYQSRPTTGSYQTARVQPAKICYECATISSVTAVQTQGQGSGAGAVAGGVVGGAIGNQMGGGNGKKALTVLGAIGGAFLGNHIEKNYKASTEYEVVVRYDQGGTNNFRFQQQPVWQPGDKVKVINGQITRTY